jgi:hypothetical protein
VVATSVGKRHNAPVGDFMNYRQDSVNRTANTLARELVQTFGEMHVRAFGTSMVPSILPGDSVVIQRAKLQEISLGDVVLFCKTDQLFIHRVVSWQAACPTGASQEPCLITRGDRLCQDDPPVSSVELLGRVVSIRRGSQLLKPTFPRGRSWRLLGHLLRASDRAAYLYLRLDTYWRRLSSERIHAWPF